MFRKIGVIPLRQLSTSALLRKEEDLISSAFLKQIRDLGGKQKAAGGSLVNSSPDIKKQLDEQLNRLAQKFKLASADVVGKLSVEFERPVVDSSVAAVTEGKSLEELTNLIKQSHTDFEKASAARQKEEAQRQAASGSNSAPNA